LVTHIRQYRYVGPGALREQAVAVDGVAVGVRAELFGWLAGQRRDEIGEPFTFVVGVDGGLRLTPRRSEHVALAGGGDVLAAGEMGFGAVPSGWRVAYVTNQSTGYCPDPASWAAVAAALDRLGVGHPGGFTDTVVFRRCPHCGERNIVREGDYTCALCAGALPPTWNFAAG
jgi:hypothetical protein